MELFLKVKYYKEDKDGNKTEHSVYHNGLLHTCLREEEYDEIYEQSVAKIMAAFDAFNKTGSGWILERVEELIMKTYRYEPMGASSYIPTPMSKIGKHAIVNVMNTEDHRCFEYSVIASLYPVQTHTEIPSQYDRHMGKLKACHPSMSIVDIPKFETANELAVSVYTIA